MDDDILQNFKEVLRQVGFDISANNYDRLIIPKPNRSTIQRRTGLSWSQLKEKVMAEEEIESAENKEGTKVELQQEFTESTGVITTKSLHIKTVEEALAYAKIDLADWEITKSTVKSSEVTMKLRQGKNLEVPETYTNFHVAVWLRRKRTEPLRNAIADLIAEIPKFKYSAVPKFQVRSGVALEIAIVDAHMAKMAWAAETGRRDYDTKIAIKDYESVIEQSLATGSIYKPEKIIFVVGHDLMHIENYQGVTPMARHILDTDSRFQKVAKAAFEINMRAVYRCRSLAPVEVVWIPGNHDPHASMWICMLLEQHFKDDSHVTVDVSPMKRKARLWGNLLVGFTHEISGKQTSWANELAQAFPILWGQSKWREWHHGHKHKKNEIKVAPILTHGGVLCRQLTALSPIDAWHFENLFTDAVPGGESFLWSKDQGVFANFTAWTDTGLQEGGEENVGDDFKTCSAGNCELHSEHGLHGSLKV